MNPRRSVPALLSQTSCPAFPSFCHSVPRKCPFVPPFCPAFLSLSRSVPGNPPEFRIPGISGTPEFFAEISSLTEPAGHYYIIPPVSFNRCPLESGYENKDMPFCPGTERWDRTPGAEIQFCPRPRRFVPGQKGGTERTVKTGYFLLFPSFKKKTANFIRLNIFFLRTKSQCNLTCQKALNNLSELTKEFFNLCPLLARM